jgi:hypothetical protein
MTMRTTIVLAATFLTTVATAEPLPLPKVGQMPCACSNSKSLKESLVEILSKDRALAAWCVPGTRLPADHHPLLHPSF